MVLMPESAQPPSHVRRARGIHAMPELAAVAEGQVPQDGSRVVERLVVTGECPSTHAKLSRFTDWWSPLPISRAPEALSMAFDQVNEFSK